MNGKAWPGGGASSGHSTRKAGVLCGLYVLMVVLFMAGCAHKAEAPPQPKAVDTKELVSREVKDPVRAEKILALMEKLGREMTLQREINMQGQQATLRLNGDYNTTPEQLQKHMESMQKSRSQNRQRIVETYFQIKALTTQAEWEALSKPDEEALRQLVKQPAVPEKGKN